MRRRSFLTVTASATALGIAGCVQEPGDRENGTNANPETSAQDGPGSQPEETASPGNGTEDPSETEMPDSDTPTDGHGSSAQAWGSSGRMNGVTFSFTSQGPETGENRDVADITRDDDAGEVIVDGTIGGSDTCKRAKLGSVEYDKSTGTLTVDVETTDIENCDMGGQALVGIDYEGTFEVDGELPSEVTVSHNGEGIASATYESSSATVAPPTTDERE